MAEEHNYGKDTRLLDRIYHLRRMRQEYEPMFYMARQAYEGKHFVYWSKETQRLSEVPQKKSVFNQIPEVSKQVDAYENFLLGTDFTFTVVPKILGDGDALHDSQMLSLLAADYYKKIRNNTIFSDYIHYALLDNVSFLEVTPNDQKNDVDIRSFDGFDILFNPLISDWNKQPLVVKVVKKDVNELKKSKLYNVSADYTGGGSGFFSWKDVYEREKYTTLASLAENEAIIFECYMLDPVEGLTIRTLDWSGNIIRNDHYRNIKRVPLIPLRIYSGSWYQSSYAYRQIPLNRSADLMISRLEDLMLRLAKGGWVLQGEENLNGGIDEEIGQIIRYDSVKPEQMEMPQIPSFFLQLFTTMLGMSDRYGFSSVATGDLQGQGSGLRTTGMLEQLTGLTVRDNSAPINNLRSSVQQILELVFMFLYEMWDTPQEVIHTDITNKFPRFVSSKYKSIYAGGEIGIPSSFKRFDVEVDDGLGYTLQAKKDTALALRKLGLVNDEVVKKIFKLGSSAYLMNATDQTMAESEEFKTLINAYPQLSPEQKQAVIIVLRTISQLQGGNPLNPGAKEKVAGGDTGPSAAPPTMGGEGGGPPPAAPPEQG